jgi:hypothetical protein
MPNGIMFQYTKGRSYFAGTDELNLEGKGVVPDVLVPVTEESAAAVMAGEDPLLTEGLRVLSEIQGKAVVAALTLSPLTPEVTGGAPAPFSGIYPEGWKAGQRAGGAAFESPDGQLALYYDTTTPEALGSLLALFGITDPQASLVDTHTANGVEWQIAGALGANNFAYRSAFAEIDGQAYVITIIAQNAIVEQISEGLLLPAIDAFAPGA